MKITLNWVNRNTGEDGTKVYRSLTTMNPASLPAPIVTLASGITTYDDTDVTRGATFFYRLGIFKGADFAISNEVSLSALPSSGPGPQTLLAGDYEAGYFGTLTALELFTGEELAFKCGLTAGALQNSGTDWLKFAYKGKILFVPKQTIRYNISWKALYNLGLVFGTNDTGTNLPASVSAAPINQQKIISKNGINYKVRLLKGAASNPYSFTTSGTYDSYGLEGSEWNDLIYKVVNQVPVAQKGGNWGTIADSAIYDANYSWSTTICQETSGVNALVRGGLVNTGVGQVGYANQIDNTILVTAAVNWLGASANYYPSWRPALEWVP